MAGFDVDQPSVGVALIGAVTLQIVIDAQVVDRHLVDRRRIEGEVAHEFADQGNSDGIPAIVAELAGEGQILERGGQSEILVIHEQLGRTRRRNHVA